ncbi:MAG: DUF3078 domain-containing protein [Marinifilaceae bacterium]
MKRLIPLFFTLLISTLTYAQNKTENKNWTLKGVYTLDFNQVYLSNWAAGGDKSFALSTFVGYDANYKREAQSWNNRLEMAYGFSQIGSDDWRKSNDRIYLLSDYGWEFKPHWYLSALLNFRTQFSNGYDYSNDLKTLISRFMSPGYLTVGPGVRWEPKSWVSLYLSPISWRGVFVTSDILSNEGAFGVKEGKHTLSEYGAFFIGQLKYEFLPNMEVSTRLQLFSDYKDKPQNVDVDWQTMLLMRVNKWFTTSIMMNLIYDDDTKILHKDGRKYAETQFKESLAVGVMFEF